MVPWRQIAVAAVAMLCLLYLGGCGTSNQEEVARVLESYPHALAAGDAQAACEAWSPQGRRAQSGRHADFCEYLRNSVSEMTPDERRRLAAAKAVHVVVEGDRATGYLRFGDCILATSGSELRQSGSGDWRIERWLLHPHNGERCLDEELRGTPGTE